MFVEINPVGGEVKVTTIQAMLEARAEVNCLARFNVEPGDVLYIEPATEKGAEPKSDPQLSFDF